MKGFLYKLPIIASLLWSNFAFSESSAVNEDKIIARKDYKRDEQKMMQPREMRHKKESSCCFESRCGCESYKRCCYPLPLPALCGWVFAEGEYLYWKTYALMPYAAQGYIVPPFTVNGLTPYSRDIKTVGLSADSGYRVTLGAYFGDCYYGLARYTQYGADGTDGFSFQPSSVAALLQQITPMWSIFPLAFQSATDRVGSLNAKHRFREKFLDFDFYRSFSCSRYTFNPFVGLRFGWVKTDVRIDTALSSTVGGDTLTNSSHVDLNHHLNLGVGLHTGMDMNIDLCWGFGFYGTSSFSALIGKKYFRIREDFTIHDTGNTAFAGTVSQSYKETDFQTVWQTGLGLNWGTHFCRCSYYFGIKIGYELNVLPNFVSLLQVFNTSTGVIGSPIDWSFWERSALTHGLNVGARFDF